jgi:hypothetical protein
VAHKAIRSGGMRTDVKYSKRVPNSLGGASKSFHADWHDNKSKEHAGLQDAHQQESGRAAQAGDFKNAWHQGKIAAFHGKRAEHHAKEASGIRSQLHKEVEPMPGGEQMGGQDANPVG